MPPTLPSTRSSRALTALVWFGTALLAISATGCDAGQKQPNDASVACTVMPPTECPPTPLGYAADIQPIFKARCVSCHDGRGEQWPLIDYGDVTDWADQVHALVADCTMPPADSGVRVPNAEREQILTWIQCGAAE